MSGRTWPISRRTFLSSSVASAPFMYSPRPVNGIGRRRSRRTGQVSWHRDWHLEMGSRHARAVCRPRPDGSEHREDAGGREAERDRDPAARQDAQMRRHRQAADGRRRDWHLHGQGQRSRSASRGRASIEICMTTSNPSASKIRRAMQLQKAIAALHSGGGLRSRTLATCRRRRKRRASSPTS